MHILLSFDLENAGNVIEKKSKFLFSFSTLYLKNIQASHVHVLFINLLFNSSQRLFDILCHSVLQWIVGMVRIMSRSFIMVTRSPLKSCSKMSSLLSSTLLLKRHSKLNLIVLF